MANRKPGSLEDLQGISGVGKTKLKRYGEDFLTVIADFPAGGGERERDGSGG